MKTLYALPLFLSLFILSSQQVNAQSAYHRCSSMEYLHEQLQLDPSLAGRMQQIEQFTDQYVKANPTPSSRAVITIPVVVHVLYNNASQNISDALIQAQINQLNLDYARLNADASNTPAAFSAVNTNIQFCLAQRDPSGNPTTGIIRKSTTVTSFSTNDKAKKSSTGGDDAWAAGSYLNIWSCNLGGGLLGYAQFPGGAASTDGVVLLYSSIGSATVPGSAAPYNYGRTATHEVGHWLNLYHIWGDDNGACSGSDNVGDTPNQGAENYGCPSYPHTDACNTTAAGVMFMNYMDYTDDGCMNAFTQGQSTRMNALFATGGSRVSILSSQGCVPPSTATCNVPASLSTSAITTSSATFNWAAVSGAISYSVQYRVTGSSTWTSASATTNSYSASGLTASTSYEWQVKTNCSSGSSAFTASTNFTTSAVATCNTPGSLATSSITSSSATLAWAAVSGATSYTVQYRVVGNSSYTTASSSTNSYSVSGLTASTNYEWNVQTVCSGGSSATSSNATFTTSAASTCSDVYEPNESLSAAKTIALNTDNTGLISNSTDNDYFKFTTTSPNTNVMVTLSNLPKDYDIRLYNSSGTQLAISQNGSTTSETIKRNTTTAATYYLRVYGYSGTYSTTSCYTLRVATGSTAFRLAGEEDATTKEVVEGVESQLKLYPNPAHDNMTVEYISNAEAKVQMNIFSLTGQKMSSLEAVANTGLNLESINTSSLAGGVYILEVQNNGVTTHTKFTVAK